MLGGDAKGKKAGVLDFKTVGIEANENIAPSCVGAVRKGIGEQFSENQFSGLGGSASQPASLARGPGYPLTQQVVHQW